LSKEEGIKIMQENESGASLKKLFLIAVAGFVFAALLALMVYSPDKPLAIQAVDPSLVCMGTDQVPGTPMIPVEINGKTYYGCCPKCNKRLRTDKGARTAADPVTSEPVDKASAFIIEGPGGMALYFKSAETAKKHLENNSQTGKI
jgi:YHS domain-containing protein